MNREYWVIAALAISSILLLTIFGRRNIRESLFVFLVAQAINWPTSILLVFFGKIESPVRLFSKATDSNFLISFVFAPAVAVAYYLNYPQQKCRIFQIAYTLAVSGIFAFLHFAIQKYTDLLEYISFSGYRMWLFGILALHITRIYSDWYFNQLPKEVSGNQ